MDNRFIIHRPAHNSKEYGHSINRSLAPIPCSKHYRTPHAETGLKFVCTDHYLVIESYLGKFSQENIP